MGRTVILGHGGFSKSSFETLVPPNTTLRFFSDAGSALVLPAFKKDGELVFDYARVADVLSNYKETEAALQAGAVVYNMELDPVDAEEQRIAEELHKQGKWGGDLMLVPTGQEWKLCHGDPSTCPTPKLHVAQKRHEELKEKGSLALTVYSKWVADGATGELPEEIADFAPRLADVLPEHLAYVADGVPEKAWKHDCGGMLDTCAGDDIFWIACSGFVAHEDEIEALGLPDEITASTAGPGMNWAPDDDTLDQVKGLNQQNVKDTPDDGETSIMVGGPLVLIGGNHAADPVNYVRRQANFAQGTLKVKKGGAFSKGSVEVSGIPGGEQELVKKSIALFSDKKVNFS